ncbi:MAG: hypothetical protein LBU04_03395 [Christensenellaceae bacterium]|jgi:hypothetical protein|nr:hypothetical protein [Christensenellaceae bacterium]
MNKKLTFLACLILILTIFVFVGCNKDTEETAISRIEIYSSPVTYYLWGQELDLANAHIKVIYEGGQEELVAITEGMISAFNKFLVGEQVLQVNFEGKTTNVIVTVEAPPLIEMTIIRNDSFKWQYVEEQNFNPRGLSLNLECELNYSVEVPVTIDMVSGYVRTRIGQQTLTITYVYSGVAYTKQIDIQVVPKSLLSMIISRFPDKTTYFKDSVTLNLVGGRMLLQYDNNYAVDVEMTSLAGLEAIWDSSTITQESDVTLIYGTNKDGGSIVAHFNVIIVEENIVDCNVVTAPTSNQLVETPLNLRGLVFAVVYTDSPTDIKEIKYITATATNVYCDGETYNPPAAGYLMHVYGYNKYLVGEQQVTIKFYSGTKLLNKTVTLTITVADKIISSIDIYRTSEFDDEGNPENEQVIYSKTEFSPFSSWTYVLKFNNGTQTLPALLPYTMKKDATSDAPLLYEVSGATVWQIVYQDEQYFKETTYTFDIVALSIENVTGFYTNNVIYRPLEFLTIEYGSSWVSLNEIFAYIEFNNGSGLFADLSGHTLDPNSFSTSDLTAQRATFTLTYDGMVKTDVEIAIKVVRYVDAFSIAQVPFRINYFVYNANDPQYSESNYEFSTQGLILSVVYNDGGVDNISDFSGGEWIFECADWTNEESYGKFTSSNAEKIIYVYNISNVSNRLSFRVSVTNDLVSIRYKDGANMGTVYVGAKIDLTDKYIIATYQNRSERIIQLTESMIEFDYAYTTVGETVEVKITYGNMQAVTTVTVVENTIARIEITALPTKTVYALGNTFDRTGLIVSVHFKNNTSSILPATAYTLSNTSTTTYPNYEVPDEKDARLVTVTYRPSIILPDSYTATFKIYIVEKAPISMVWTSSRPTVEITEGSEFKLDKIEIFGSPGVLLSSSEISVSYNDGTETTMSLNTLISQLTVINYNSGSRVDQIIEIKYANGCTLQVLVRMITRELYTISVSPSSITVIENASIDLSELQLHLLFTDSTYADAPVLDENIYVSATNPQGYDKSNSIMGTRVYQVAYTYNGITRYCDISITTIEKTLMAVTIGIMPKTQYLEGEPFTVMDVDGTSGTLILTYDNGNYEEKNLTEAESQSTGFYINKVKFNNNEFSGKSNAQTIYIYYVWNNIEFRAEYDIIMNDRRNVVVEYVGASSGATTNYTYGDFSDENGLFDLNAMPTARIKYYRYYSTDATEYFDTAIDANKGNLIIDYVRVEEYPNYISANNPGDYSYMRSVGSYYVILKYSGNANNNAFVSNSTNSPIVTIVPKKAFVLASSINKVYGENHTEDYTIQFYGDTNGLLDVRKTPFAYDDTFSSENFALQNTDGTPSYYGLNLIEYVSISIYNELGESITVRSDTPVSTYSIFLSGIVSQDYSISYVNVGETAAKYTVSKRQVMITPIAMSVEYGLLPGEYSIAYTTSKIDGDAMSGIVGADQLAGALAIRNSMLASARNVGFHIITLGTLSNANYQLLLPYNPEIASDNHVLLEIIKKDIYLKAFNASSTYGYGNQTIIYGFYSDSAAVNTDAFAYNDESIGLGVVEIRYYSKGTTNLIDPLTEICGTYDILAVISQDLQSLVYNNYNVISLKGDLDIEQREINVSIVSLEKTYGDPDPNFELQYNIQDMVNEAPLLGSPERIAGDGVGVYLIGISSMIAQNTNYKLMLAGNAFLTINPKNLTLHFIDPNNGGYFTGDSIERTYNGKFPSISYNEYDLLDQNSELNQAYDKDNIAFTFEATSSAAGRYALTLIASDPNYNVNFAYQGRNYYRINSKSLNESDFILTADGAPVSTDLVYNYNSSFIMALSVKTESIEILYDQNNNQMKDDLSRPIRDVINIIYAQGSTLNVSNAGSYYITVAGISNPNYIIPTNLTVRENFVVKPRELKVKLRNAVYNSTLGKYIQERTYDSAPLALYSNSEFDILDGSTVKNEINVQLKVTNPFAPEFQLTPTAVLYDENGNIVPYDIEILPFTQVSDANNFSVKFFAEGDNPYKLLVNRRQISVSLFDENLKKNFDNKQPSISSAICQISDTSTSLSFNSLVFSFTRTTDIYRATSEVGDYSIGLACYDTNHTVTLDGDYIYSILKVNIQVEIASNRLVLTYDGSQFSFSSNEVVFRSVIDGATAPRIRTLYNNTSDTSLKTAFSNSVTQATGIRSDIDNIDPTSDPTILNARLNSLKSRVDAFKTYFSGTVAPFMAREESAYKDIILSYFNSLLDAITSASYASDMLNLTQSMNAISTIANNLYNAVINLDSYIVFIIDGDATNANALGYGITMSPNDFNREFILNFNIAAPPKVRISPATITIILNNGTSIYGESTALALNNSISYTVYLGAQGSQDITSNISDYGITAKFKISTSDSWPYPANTYAITADDGYGTTSNNYLLAPLNSANFVITPRNIYYHWEGRSSKINYYGETVLKNSSYLDLIYYSSDNSGLASGLLNSDSTLVPRVNSYNVDGYLYINNTWTLQSIFGTTAKPNAGNYLLIDYGSTFSMSSNYKVNIISPLNKTELWSKDIITINKATLALVANNNIISRVYGFAWTPIITGFKYTDTIDDLAVNNVPFNLVAKTNGAYLNTLSMPVQSNLPVSFNPPQTNWQNYVFDDSFASNTFYLTITKSTLNIKLQPNTVDNSFTMVYGSTPIYQQDYDLEVVGLHSHDQGHLSEIKEKTQVDFYKHVSDVTPLGYANMSFPTENSSLNANTQTALQNYNLGFISTPFVVTKATLTIGLNISTTIHVMKNTELGLYRVKYIAATNSNTGVVTISSLSLVSGIFSMSQVTYSGLVGGDTVGKIISSHVATITTTQGAESGYTENTRYLDTNMVPYVVYGYNKSQVGEQSVRLSVREVDLFISEEPDYNVVYTPFTVHVHDSLTSMDMSETNKLLATDTDFSLSDLEFILKYQSGATVTSQLYQTDSNNYLSVVSGNIPSIPNQNEWLTVQYSLRQALKTYDGATSLTFMHTNATEYTLTLTGTSAILPASFSDTNSLTVAIRRYDINTVNYSTHPVFDNNSDYVYGSEINSESGSTNISIVDNSLNKKFEYDVIDTTVRLVANYTANFSYILLVNGSFTSDYLAIEFKEGGIFVVYSLSGTVSQIANISSARDIFDGFTHNIKIYYNKEASILNILIDNNYLNVYDNSAVSVAQYNPTVSGHISIESSNAGFVVNNAKAWVRHFYIYQQGYKDIYGTVARAGTSTKVIYISDALQSAQINISSLFATQRSLGKINYTFEYKVNGVMLTTQSEILSRTMTLGRHFVELTIKNPSLGLEEYCALNVIITNSPGEFTISSSALAIPISVVGPSNPVNLYGYNRVSGTDYISGTAEIRNNFMIQPSARYSKISLDFSIERAKFNTNAYRNNNLESYIIFATNNHNFEDFTAASTASVSNGYYGIALALRYDASGNVTEARLHIKYNMTGTTSSYYKTLTGITWNTTSVYSAELIFNNNSSDDSYDSMSLIIRNNGIIVSVSNIDSQFYFDDYSTIPQSQIRYIMNNYTQFDSRGRRAAISLSDTKITLRSILFGESTAQHDYIIDNQYVQNIGTPISVASDKAITLSDAYSNAYFGNYDTVKLAFSGTQSGSFDYAFAFSGRTLLSGRSLRLYYDGTSLYFTFYDYEASALVQYAMQKISDVELFNGDKHTIQIIFDRSISLTLASVAGVLEANGSTIDINKITVIVDGIAYGSSTPIIFPATQNLVAWVKADGNTTNSYTANNARFLASVNGVEFKASVPIAIHGFETAAINCSIESML